MKKFIASCVIGGGLILSSVVGASAAAGQTMPGTRGEPNCKGQTTAFLAQLFNNEGGQDPEEFSRPGFGNFAKILNTSTQDLQDRIRDECNGESE